LSTSSANPCTPERLLLEARRQGCTLAALGAFVRSSVHVEGMLPLASNSLRYGWRHLYCSRCVSFPFAGVAPPAGGRLLSLIAKTRWTINGACCDESGARNHKEAAQNQRTPFTAAAAYATRRGAWNSVHSFGQGRLDMPLPRCMGSWEASPWASPSSARWR